MADRVPVLIGTAGIVAGECFVLNDGSDLVIGRSRSCDISLRRMPQYLKAPAAERDADHDLNTVSRRHVRLQVHDARVRVQDLSSNGTWCDDRAVAEPREVDLSAGGCTLRLGTRETFRLEMLPRDDARVRSAAMPDVLVGSGSARRDGGAPIPAN